VQKAIARYGRGRPLPITPAATAPQQG